MKTIPAIVAVSALAIGTPATAGGAPAARLSIVSPQTAQRPTSASPRAARPASASKRTLPVPGYKFIAAGMLLGIAGVFVGLANQDGTPDSD